MKKHLIKFEKQLKNKFIYYMSGFDILGNDIYFCKCGNKIIAHPNETSFSIKLNNGGISSEYDDENLASFGIDSFGSAFRKANITCSSCFINYSEPSTYNLIQNLNVKFYDKFEIHEDKNSITLYKLRGGANYNKDIITSEPISNIEIFESYLKIYKKSKRIMYKSFNQNDLLNKVSLENIIKISKDIFKADDNISIIDGFINIHDFIGRIAKLTLDGKNMHIIEELMSLMIGKTGTNILQRTLAIFLGILSYSNLSTISLTKGNIFLYDLLEKCPLPSSQYLKRKKATSPIKIFNILVSLKNELMQQELDQDDTNKLGYVFKTVTGKKINIKYEFDEIEIIDNENSIVGKESGNAAMVFVRDQIKNRKISPYIFNKLKSFNDYEKLIKWLKFIKYEELINLVKQYDIELLNVIFSKIEFRDDINYTRLQQFIPLMVDYSKFKELHKIKTEDGYIMSENTQADYNSINSFDFSLYDDSLRMIYELKYDPNKVLYKIKKFEKLGKFHSELTKYRNYISNAEANKSYIENSSRFKFLEGNKIHSERLYSLTVSLIPTPKELLDEAISMKNCAGSYISKVANGEYIPFIVYDNSTKRESNEYYKYMMILKVTYLGLEFVGIKSICNQYGSDRFKTDVKQFLIDNDISFQEVPSIKLGVNSSEKSYDGTFEKVI